jgi:catechol 2,3-dioxygenase-like lactoylglutathione lyase family enzyme
MTISLVAYSDRLFDHVVIRVANRAASERFYDTALRTLGLEARRAGRYTGWGEFWIAEATGGEAVTRGLHVGFFALSHDLVDEFWRAGTEAGHRDDGAPGPRPRYRRDYYGAFLLDPDGNSIEAVHHGLDRERGQIDHLWIRVADLAASRRFYETIAPPAGLRRVNVLKKRVHFAGAKSSFALVGDDRKTEPFHMAFPADDDETVREFHRIATEAGYPDNGAPGERSEYHAGYYGAFILDPDGNNVEVVNHNR